MEGAEEKKKGSKDIVELGKLPPVCSEHSGPKGILEQSAKQHLPQRLWYIGQYLAITEAKSELRHFWDDSDIPKELLVKH